MAKANEKESKGGKWSKSIKTGLTATGFITAVLVVLVICFIFEVDIKFLAVGLAIVLVLVVGLPLFLHSVRENNDRSDEQETCRPIIQEFEKRQNVDKLIAEYRAWQKGEHSTYLRVHFGGDVVYALQGAKAYDEALEILHELGEIEMKGRERYDYETYRDQVEPQLLEGIEKEKKRAAERARNKNLK